MFCTVMGESLSAGERMSFSYSVTCRAYSEWSLFGSLVFVGAAQMYLIR